MKLLKPFLAGVLFFAVAYYFSYIFHPTTNLQLFISSPFNITTEGNPLYNLYAPTVLIIIVAAYLKNFNEAFMRKASLRAVFIASVAASYLKSYIGMFYYNGGISLGTSIITVSFLAAFVIALEVFVQNKQEMAHIYSHFLIYLLTALFLMLIFFIALGFFTGTSAFVHEIGILSFLLIFIPYYERGNITIYVRNRERRLYEEAKKAGAIRTAQ